jgi:pyruvate formate lyase activating enzyme
MALDPIEKKPLLNYFSGFHILSVGSYGCNLSCPFCQNHSISMATSCDPNFTSFTPEELVGAAQDMVSQRNIGIAFTYNEPLISYEFVRDCFQISQPRSLKNILVTNGYICEEPLLALLPYVDAMNIDLKGFTPEFYYKLGGDLETVKNTIRHSAKSCHLEITTLIIPGENDSTSEIAEMAAWIASIDRNIPLHLSRFFPRFHYESKKVGDVDKIYELVAVASSYLNYVFAGNC